MSDKRLRAQNNSHEAVEKLNGRNALLRVRDGKPNTDAEHRGPTGSRLYDQSKCFHCFP